MKAGIYYSTIFSKESLDCMAQIAAGIGGVKK